MKKMIKIYTELNDLFYKFDNTLVNSKDALSKNNIKIYFADASKN
jgi:hypothetical protein